MAHFINVTDESLENLTNSFKDINSKRISEKATEIQETMFQVTDVKHEAMMNERRDEINIADFWNTGRTIR